MLIIKNNVRISGLKQEMLHALDEATAIFKARRVDCVLTSGRESGHSNHSHHYKGLAIDLRSKHLTGTANKYGVLSELKATLGDEYQVFFENEGKLQEHFHIEYDPKGM